MTRRQVFKWIGVVLLIAIAGLLIWGYRWVSDPYQADDVAQAAWERADHQDDWYAFGSSEATKGLVFYGGGLVEATAYAALAEQIATESNAFVVVPYLTLNLAVLEQNAAAPIMDSYPNVRQWAVGGHSLGGSMAASFANDNPDVAGLLLWASYPSNGTDLSNDQIVAAAIFGAQDGLVTEADRESSAIRLPATTDFVLIEGGVHAYFGNYGPQDGDGTPTVERQVAQSQIVAASAILVDEMAE